MSLNESIASDVQNPSLGGLITLFKVDCSSIGGSVYRFVPATVAGTTVYFNSLEYTPIDIEGSGFEYRGKGQLPRPKFKLSNTTHTMQAAITQYDDLLGVPVTRIRTFEKYLDGKPDADPLARFPDDLYVIERKVTQTKQFIEWELSAYMDFEGKILPNRQVLRDTCIWIYRVWDSVAGAFNYDNVGCPYTGSSMFKKDGTITTTPSEDVCGKRLSDCVLRYNNNPLPFGGFPGVGKIH